MSAKSDVFWALKVAQSQSTSLLHRGKPSGLQYEGEARGLLFALRAIAAEQRSAALDEPGVCSRATTKDAP